METATFSSHSSREGRAAPLKAGALGGLGGGLVFGMMMGLMGMLPMVAGLVGSSSAAAGFALHMGISVFIGALFGVAAHHLPARASVLLGAGLVNGVIWWLIGALLLLPIGLGRPQMAFVVGPPQLMSLAGHVLFGLVAAAIFIRLDKRG
jgi:uncharacterized membrane protein YagU involved in acid resistance